MASLNQATIIGFVGGTPKINTTQNGRKMASFSVATTEKGYQKKDGTVIQDKTEWHNIVIWGSLAEIAEKYLHSGSSVLVQGKIRTRSYDDKNGTKRYITEIDADTMQMLDRKPTDQQPSTPPYQTQTQAQSPQSNYYPSSAAPAKKDDDLPF